MMTRINKKILVIDLILLFGVIASLVGLFFYFNSNQIAFSPAEDIAQTNILFRIEKGKKILICEKEPECDKPKQYEIKDKAIIELKKGEYYWSILDENYQEIRLFDLKTDASFMLEKLEDNSFYVVNAGKDKYVVDENGMSFVLGGKNE